MLQVYRVSRRTFIRQAAAALLAVSGASAVTQPPLDVPRVDKLDLHVIVDNATFGPFLPDQELSGLSVQRGGRSTASRMPPKPLMAEFGLSILAKSTLGAQTRELLVDLGYSAEVLANNLALLGVEPERLDAAVLSHGHLDHYGGFRALFARPSGRTRPLPLIVGGEEVFCERVAAIGNPAPVMGALDRAELVRAGLQPHISAEPMVVAEHAFTTGTIPLLSFERAAIPTEMRPGVGCDRASLDPAKRGASQLADDAGHELATCYVVKGLGLVVIASCSHRGVLNSVRRAQAVSGIETVHAVVGGFHLVRPRTEEEARRTVAEFETINPRYIVPMHCTGEAFIAEAMRRMPEKIVRPYVGSRFIFSS